MRSLIKRVADGYGSKSELSRAMGLKDRMNLKAFENKGQIQDHAVEAFIKCAAARGIEVQPQQVNEGMAIGYQLASRKKKA